MRATRTRPGSWERALDGAWRMQVAGRVAVVGREGLRSLAPVRWDIWEGPKRVAGGEQETAIGGLSAAEGVLKLLARAGAYTGLAVSA